MKKTITFALILLVVSISMTSCNKQEVMTPTQTAVSVEPSKLEECCGDQGTLPSTPEPSGPVGGG